MPGQSHKTGLIVPLTQPSVEGMRSAMAAAAAGGADMVECRLDYLAGDPVAALPQLLAGRRVPVIATHRPVRQGGRFTGPEADRLAVLAEAARLGAEYVDLELDALRGNRAWLDELRGQSPTTRVILSHHDFAGVPGDLDAIAAELDRSPADVSKLAFAARGPEDALTALNLLRRCRKPALVLAMGDPGGASRILAGKFGGFGTFAALDEGAESAPGQMTLRQMKTVFRFGAVGPATRVYGVIGCPLGHSMSPAVHNAAFEAEQLDAVYVPLRIEPGAENFNRFLDAALAAAWADFGGFSVTIPHKENAFARVGARSTDRLSAAIGAVNTVRIDPDGRLRGWNTDYAAAVNALCSAMGIQREHLRGRRAAVLGAGGVARAVVAALTHYQADVTIYNRTVSRGRQLAEEFSCRAAGLEELPALSAEIVVNCTSVGMHPDADRCPLEAIPPGVKVVFDTIYNPPETRLLRQGRAAGCVTVSGLEMFVNQAAGQFEIWFARPAPRARMRQAVLEQLPGAKP